MKDQTVIENALEAMRKEMPEIVARHKIKQYQSFPYSKGLLQNEDSAGTGPEDAFYCGRYRYYHRERLLAWVSRKMRV